MRKLILFFTFLIMLCCFQAQATVLTFNDSSDLSSWRTDRYTPDSYEIASFEGESVLKISISGDDQQSSSFYNYQGIKHDFGDSVSNYSIVADLYIDSGWADSTINVGIWGTIYDENMEVCAYPIIAYRNSADVDAGFYGFDYENGGWYLLSLVGSYGEWYSLEMIYNSSSLLQYINGELVGTFADTISYSGTIGNIILNSYNSGSDYTVYWDNVGTSPVPEPATMILLGAGMVGLAGARRKLKK